MKPALAAALALLLPMPVLADVPVNLWSGHTTQSGPYTTGQYDDADGNHVSTYRYRDGTDTYSQSTWTAPDGTSRTVHCTTHIISGRVEQTCY